MGFDPLGDAIFGSNNNPVNQLVQPSLPGIGGGMGLPGMGGMTGSIFGGQGNVSPQNYVPSTMTDWSKYFSQPSNYSSSSPNMYSHLFGNNNGQSLVTGQSTQYTQPSTTPYQSNPNTQYTVEGVANALTKPENTQVGWRNYNMAPQGQPMNHLTSATDANNIVTNTPTAPQIAQSPISQPMGQQVGGFDPSVTSGLQGLSTLFQQYTGAQNRPSTNNLG